MISAVSVALQRENLGEAWVVQHICNLREAAK